MPFPLKKLDPEFLTNLRASIDGRFELIEGIGEGKNGITLKAKAQNSAELYCLKTIHPTAIIDERVTVVADKLKKEVNILSPLDHRCLPKIIFSDVSATTPFYVCTFHPGKTFYKFRQAGSVLAVEQTLFVIHSIIDVFDYLNKHGRSHCDAHQDNILIGDNVFRHGIMLIDFGSGHRQSDSDPMTMDGRALHFKEPHIQARHQKTVARAGLQSDFDHADRAAVGALLSVMKPIFFADASLRQIDEYDDFCSDLQRGQIASWDAARERLKFVIDPDHLQSQLNRYYEAASPDTAPILIPTTKPFKLGAVFGELVETPTFQRLRGIKQLSFCDWVFPGAVHNRFEHSLGVFQVALEGVDYLCTKKPFRRQFTEIHLSALVTASLLHDIGHYPFAHVLEHYIASRFSDNIELRQELHHGQYTKWIIENDPHISRTLKSNLSTEHISEIINILGSKRGFLTQLLDSTLDFDKIDYLKRDSYHCNKAYGRGYEVADLLKGMQFVPPHNSIYFSEDNAHAVSGFLVLQAQMLATVTLT